MGISGTAAPPKGRGKHSFLIPANRRSDQRLPKKSPLIEGVFVWLDDAASGMIVRILTFLEILIMCKDGLESASSMLRAMIAGASCEQIAADFKLTKSAVSQKIRMLANDLQQIVGVVGVDEDESPTAALIRHHGDGYLEALEHFVPDAASAWRDPVIELASCRIAQHITKIARHSRCVERDSALLLILFATAAKPLEIAQLEVCDYLDETGEARLQSSIRASIAVNGKERPLLFCDHELTAAIDTYLVLRRAQGMAAHNQSSYRGLLPHSRLFLSRNGKPMAVKRSGPGSQHLVCKEIHEIYRRIFAHSGHSGINTAMARRLAARRLHLGGANAEDIGAALGVKKLAVHKLLQPFDCEMNQPRPKANGSTQPNAYCEDSLQARRTA